MAAGWRQAVCQCVQMYAVRVCGCVEAPVTQALRRLRLCRGVRPGHSPIMRGGRALDVALCGVSDLGAAVAAAGVRCVHRWTNAHCFAGDRLRRGLWRHSVEPSGCSSNEPSVSLSAGCQSVVSGFPRRGDVRQSRARSLVAVMVPRMKNPAVCGALRGLCDYRLANWLRSPYFRRRRST